MCGFVVVLEQAVIFVIGGYSNTVCRLSVSDSSGVTHLQNGPSVPVYYQYAEDASAIVDHRTRITLIGGFSKLDQNIRYDLVWYLETTDVTPRWTRGPNLITGRRRHIGFRLGTYLYVGMGRDIKYGSDHPQLSGLESLDSSTQSSIWEQTGPSYPLNVSDAACVVIQNQGVDEVWVTGGYLAPDIYTGLGTNAVYSWRGPSYSWQQQAYMIRKRYAHSMASDGVRIWVVGGKEKHMAHGDASVEVYHQGSWSLVSPLPAWRYGGVSVMWGDFLVQIGGFGPSSGGGIGSSMGTGTLFVLSITNNTWSLSDIHLNSCTLDATVALITP